MNKQQYLELVISQFNYTSGKNYSGITLELVLDIISKPTYNIVEEIRDIVGCAKQTVTNYLKKTFPDRDPIHDRSIDSWLLSKIEHKYCSNCDTIYSYTEFNKNITKSSRLQDYCKECSREARRGSYAKNPSQEIVKNGIRRRNMHVPPWQDIKEILLFYKNRPIGYHVDHIIPINGELVSGLHCISNLQYLIAEDNLAKGNKYAPVV